MEYIYLTRHKRDQSVMVEKKRKKQILSLAAFEKSFLFGFGNNKSVKPFTKKYKKLFPV